MIRALLLTALLGGVALGQPGGTPPGTVPPPPPTPGNANSPTPVNEPPPNGPGLGVPKPVNTTPIQLNAKEMEELKSVEADYEAFLKSADAHDARMRMIARREFDTRTAELERRYAERIAKAENDRVHRHGDAIVLLEKFLQNHPNHEQYTPDKMYQLADLYLDKADEDIEALQIAQEKTGKPATADSPPQIADYSKSLALWEGILTRFPAYRQTPQTLYLLAYYGKLRDDRKSLQTFLALTCANHFKWNDTPAPIPTRAEALKRVEMKTLRDPYADCTPYPNAETELVRHAWVRGVADYQFTVAGELDDAIAAYLKVANGGNESKMYAESLYKLAWSYYKRDFLLDSIKRFDESVKLYDAIVASGGTPALELREESIQYIAVAFTDPWEGETDTDPVKAFNRAKEFYKGKENEPYVRDVWVAMGHAFGELQAWDQAVASFRVAIGPPWELNSKNPVVHQEIVNAYESKGDKFAADQAAAELATRYQCPGSAWCQANEKDREAMENQRRIAERALYAAARNTHSAATVARTDYEGSSKKDPGAKQDYLALYSKAIELYKQFVTTYPDSDYVYEFNYLEAEALYWSEHYMDAAKQYRWVRDHKDIGTVYYLDAARSVVASYQAEATREADEGKIAKLNVLSATELKALPQPLQPQPIPTIYTELQGELDNYQNVIPDPKVAPTQGIQAALISLAYLHTEDAITRFNKVITQFCHTPPDQPAVAAPVKKGQKAPPVVLVPWPAAKAKDGILAIYEATGNLDAFETTNKNFIQQGCGDKGTRDLAGIQNQSLAFERATNLYKAGQFIPAAEAFYRFYKSPANLGSPSADHDLPIALYNAAISYKLGDKPKTAIALFKEFTNNPAKNFRESPFFLDAMRLTAASYQAAFEYDNAIKTYLELVDTTKKAQRLGIKPPDPLPGEKPLSLAQIGLDALYNAALVAELNRDFKKAVDLYGQYGRVEPDHRKQDRALWSIAGIYRQSGDVGNMVDTLDRWRSRYGRDAGNADDFVQSFYDTAVAWKRKGRTAQERAAGQAAIDAWKQRGSVKKERGAQLAGEWALTFAEELFKTQWEPFAIKGVANDINDIKRQKREIDAIKTKTEDKFRDLDQFGVVEITMAATVRYGDVQNQYAQKLAEAPIPRPIASVPSAVVKFEETRDANSKKYNEEAKKSWILVLEQAKKGNISNKWSRLALEELGRDFPTEFTPLRQELLQGTDAP